MGKTPSPDVYICRAVQSLSEQVFQNCLFCSFKQETITQQSLIDFFQYLNKVKMKQRILNRSASGLAEFYSGHQ